MTRGATATPWNGSPPARRHRHNFTELPRIRSERPAFELHYPHMADRMRAEAHVGRQRHPNLATESTQPATNENDPSRG